MAEVHEIKSPVKKIYGTTIRKSAKLGRATEPIQVLGLTPANSDNTNTNRPCTTHHVFSGDKNCFVFDFPVPFSFAGINFPFFLQNISTNTKISLSLTGLAEIFEFGYWDSYPNRSGVCINWSKVLSQFGSGKYYFFIEEGEEPAVEALLLYGNTEDALSFGADNELLTY